MELNWVELNCIESNMCYATSISFVSKYNEFGMSNAYQNSSNLDILAQNVYVGIFAQRKYDFIG